MSSFVLSYGSDRALGRTNCVIDMCRDAGIMPPAFEQITGSAVITFGVDVAGPRQVTPQVAGQVTALVDRVLEAGRPPKLAKNFRMQLASSIGASPHSLPASLAFRRLAGANHYR